MAGSAKFVGGHIVVRCEACASEGTNPTINAIRRSTPENDAALQAHVDKCRAAHDGFKLDAADIVDKTRIQAGQSRERRAELINSRREQLRALATTSAEVVKKLTDETPKDATVFVVESCPWCGEKMDAEVKREAE